MNLLSLITIFVGLFISTAHAETACPFDSAANAYEGDRAKQAICLLRQVKRFGLLAQEEALPSSLDTLMKSAAVDISVAELQKYLKRSNISETDVGGDVSKPLNPKTRYFIIHDTSSPNFGANPIPENINTASWKGNTLATYSTKAHVYINRVGASTTKVNLSENHRTTKFELLAETRRSLYVGIELIQPRRSYPDGSNKNDGTAPMPGFTESQLERLATVYLAASVRAGIYLIPAFHSVVDAGLKGGHDDPQNFDLKAWVKALEKIINQIKNPTASNAKSPNVELTVTQSTTTSQCVDYALWRKVNKDCSWTKAAEAAATASSLSKQTPSDIADFCPNYVNLEAERRNMFWAGLLSAVARPESNYKPGATYTENFTDGSGKKVISRGLLQISIESANQKRYACGIKKSEDLHDSTINLSCGVKILESWVVNDNTIASYTDGQARGGGRYWSVLRKSNNHLPEITGNTASLPFCKK
jgi:Transglycosylase SLT domain